MRALLLERIAKDRDHTGKLSMLRTDGLAAMETPKTTEGGEKNPVPQAQKEGDYTDLPHMTRGQCFALYTLAQA